MDNDKIKIRLTIADRVYPFTIDKGMEQSMREAAEAIKERVTSYKFRYPNKETVDALAIVTLHLALHANKLAQQNNVDEITQEIDDINNLLEEYIDKY